MWGDNSKNCPLLDSHQKEDTQTQNKTRQNYYTCRRLRTSKTMTGIHIGVNVTSKNKIKYSKIYCIPRSRNFFCHSHAERSVSSIGVSDFHPNSLLANEGSAHT